MAMILALSSLERHTAIDKSCLHAKHCKIGHDQTICIDSTNDSHTRMGVAVSVDGFVLVHGVQEVEKKKIPIQIKFFQTNTKSDHDMSFKRA